jgi:hypothetical protein
MLCKALGDGHYGNQANIRLYLTRPLLLLNLPPWVLPYTYFGHPPILRFYLINIFFIFDIHVLFTPNVFLSKRNFSKNDKCLLEKHIKLNFKLTFYLNFFPSKMCKIMKTNHTKYHSHLNVEGKVQYI